MREEKINMKSSSKIFLIHLNACLSGIHEMLEESLNKVKVWLHFHKKYTINLYSKPMTMHQALPAVAIWSNPMTAFQILQQSRLLQGLD